ncbi:hypothetical protein BGZ57DRAFT_858962 [Hyaloscypha finlandica]|nr:hypothetical protein BGZ57DRAFT_858962 [Hyaloscypha finlandica]
MSAIPILVIISVHSNAGGGFPVQKKAFQQAQIQAFVSLPREARQFSASKPNDKAPIIAPCNGVRLSLEKIVAQSDGITRHLYRKFTFRPFFSNLNLEVQSEAV